MRYQIEIFATGGKYMRIFTDAGFDKASAEGLADTVGAMYYGQHYERRITPL